MSRKRTSPEQIIRHLRQAEVLSSQGRSVSERCRDIGITENTYYRWRKEYGGIGVDQARGLKELERENEETEREKDNEDKSKNKTQKEPNFSLLDTLIPFKLRLIVLDYVS